MFKYLLLYLLLFITATGFSQITNPIKYKDLFFSTVSVQKNLSYTSVKKDGIRKSAYQFDLYEPETDSSQKRPLIIWLHGGGFNFGSKNARGIKLWCESFAKRGYVCVALNYRLSKKLPIFNFLELKRSCYNAVLDIDKAVQWFKNNQAKYRIDTSHIILAGNSAGGMIALQAVYSSKKELAVSAHLPDSKHYPVTINQGNIAAVINFWGGLFKIDWLRNANIPILSVHGSDDKIVVFDHKNTSFFGSLAIHKTADSLHIPNSIKIYQGYSHELQKHFNPFFKADKATQKRWLEAGVFAADFLYTQLFTHPFTSANNETRSLNR